MHLNGLISEKQNIFTMFASLMKKLKAYIKLLRNEFTSSVLDETNVSRSPLIQFTKWLQNAVDANVIEPNAMTLATASKEGLVDARIVLLRDFDSKGFSFFTNYNSIKGREIRHNKKACLNFFWPELQRQVRIKGIVDKLSPRVSDQYFITRPRESQIAAWASHQSERLINRNELESRYLEYEKKFTGQNVPRPPHWGGFRLKPDNFEFWQGRLNRLHDRVIYEHLRNGKWEIQRLNP